MTRTVRACDSGVPAREERIEGCSPPAKSRFGGTVFLNARPTNELPQDYDLRLDADGLPAGVSLVRTASPIARHAHIQNQVSPHPVLRLRARCPDGAQRPQPGTGRGRDRHRRLPHQQLPPRQVPDGPAGPLGPDGQGRRAAPPRKGADSPGRTSRTSCRRGCGASSALRRRATAASHPTRPSWKAASCRQRPTKPWRS